MAANGIAPASISATQIAPNAIGAAQIAPGTIGASHIAPAGVGATQIAPAGVGANHIAPASVGATHIAPGAVGPTQLATGAVNGTTIADGSITTADILDGPRAGFAESATLVALGNNVDTVLLQLTLAAPAAGKVIAHASGTFGMPNIVSKDSGTCSLSTAPVVNFNQQSSFEEHAPDATAFAPFATSRGFDVTAGPFSVYLVCRGGFVGSTLALNSSLTAMFIAGS